MTKEILDRSARDIASALRRKEFSCVELMQATLARISQSNPIHNAIVAMLPSEVLLAQAQQKDQELVLGIDHGFLHGIPQAIKDISPVKGMVTSLGSPNLKNAVSPADSLMVERMRTAGCIIIGRTNTPEFGLGSHTFNPVYGRTLNAYHPVRTAGGSSGGAAVALAHHMLAIADGSDFMGSLRNPAGWNNIFGMRPSYGRIPMAVEGEQFVSQMAIEGPMARNVGDLAALLQVQAGYDRRAPLSLENESYEEVIDGLKGSDATQMKGLRVGWLADLNGYLATEVGVLTACQQGLARMESAGAVVEPVSLGIAPEKVWECWLVWRRWLVSSKVAVFYANPAMRALMKPEAQWEAEQGAKLNATEVFAASTVRTQVYQVMAGLLERYDVLAMPTAQLWPFDVNLTWPREINTGSKVVSMDTYHRWMETVIYATLAGLPAISVPSGFSNQQIAPLVPEGLPIGMQLIGQPRGDAKLLKVAQLYETLIGDWLAVKPKA